MSRAGVVKQDFRERLREGPILCDGAMGTVLDLYEYPDLPHDIQNIRNPDIVERIHREYVDAGAEITPKSCPCTMGSGGSSAMVMTSSALM